MPQPHSFRPNSNNPLVQALGVVIGIVFLAAAALIGLAFLATLVGAVVLGAIILSIRMWWLRRKFGSHDGGKDNTVIEGEYRIVETKTKHDEE